MKKLEKSINYLNHYLIKKARSVPIFYRLLIAFFLVIIIFSATLISFVYDVVEDRIYHTNINYVVQNVQVVNRLIKKELNTFTNRANEFTAQKETVTLLETCDKLSATKGEKYKACKQKLNTQLYDFFTNRYIESAQIVTDQDQFVQQKDKYSVKGARIENLSRFIKSSLYLDAKAFPYQSKFHNTIKENDVYVKNRNPNISLGNYLTLATPIRSSDQEVLGVLILNLNISFLTGSVDIEKQFNQDLYLVDRKGIIAPLSSNYFFFYYPDRVWKKIYQSEGRVAKFTISEGDRIAVSDNLEELKDWKVLSILNVSNLMTEARKIRDITIILTSIALVVSVIICLFVTGTIHRPLRNLVTSMKHFGKQHEVKNYDDPYQDEIGSAGKQFLIMVDQINEAVEKEIAEKTKRKEAEFKALQMQINPHFVYNTLDIIRWKSMSLEEGDGRLSQTIGGLAQLFRYNLSLKEGQVKVLAEAANIKQYVQVLSLLHDTDLKLNLSYQEDEIKEQIIPKFIFQPIVENAIVHGKVHRMEKGEVNIYLKNDSDGLNIQFTNNGKPISQEKVAYIQNKLTFGSEENGSIGLANIHERIRLLFGEDYGLSVGADELGRLSVFIRLPIIYTTDKYRSGR